MPEKSADQTNVGRQNSVKLLVIQATSFCNLDCGYCYVPERTVRKVLRLELLDRLAELVVDHLRANGQSTLDVLWHAGEPLTAGLTFYEDASVLFDRRFRNGPSIRQAMQSNGLLINEAWCDFFVNRRVAVGLSLDGPRHVHDSRRRHRGGSGSFDKAIAAARLLRGYAVDTGALCVLTPLSICEPELMFDFFVSTGIENVAFNVEETEGENRRSSLVEAFSRRQLVTAYSSFMERFLEMNCRAGSPLRVREMMSMLQRFRQFRETGAPPHDAERVAGAILTMTRDGDLSSWSPELVSVPASNPTACILGHVSELGSIDEALHGAKARAVQDEIEQGVEMCRRTCPYFSVCGGGSPSNKLFENGTFASTETMHCATQVKALSEVVLSGRLAH